LVSRIQVRDGALDAADLRHVGEIEVVVKGRTGEQAALLQAPVALIERGGAVGEMRLREGA
jgi:hypothetical protein